MPRSVTAWPPEFIFGLGLRAQDPAIAIAVYAQDPYLAFIAGE
jgi:hypothetical protein